MARIRPEAMMIDGGAEVTPTTKKTSTPVPVQNFTPYVQPIATTAPVQGPGIASATPTANPIKTAEANIAKLQETITQSTQNLVDFQAISDEIDKLMEDAARFEEQAKQYEENAKKGITFASPTPGTPTTDVDVFRATLLSKGYPEDLVDDIVQFDAILRNEGISEPAERINLVYYSKEFTTKAGVKYTSPYYQKYGYMQEGLANKKTPTELVATVQGIRALQPKYSTISSKFFSNDSIQKFIQKDVSVDEVEERINMAQMRAASRAPQDTLYKDTLKKLGYINSDQDLTDFYLDNNIGKQEMETRRATFALAAEIAQRQASGLTINKANLERYVGQLASQGTLSERAVMDKASEAYQTVAEQLQPLTKYEGIYTKTGAMAAPDIQAELEQEQLFGLASARRKRLEEQNIRAFQGQAGTAIGAQGLLSQRGIGTAGLI